MKVHKFPYKSFIAGWYMPEKICNDIIYFFEKNKEHHGPGLVSHKDGPVTNKNIKDSIEMGIMPDFLEYPFNDYRKYLDNLIKRYEKKYRACNFNMRYNLHESYNIQKYEKGGGFKKMHFERTRPCHRILVFMTYLNDVEDGGTYFHYQKITAPAKKGLTLIWPTDFTHAHKGVISYTKEKYIVTGWYGYTL